MGKLNRMFKYTKSALTKIEEIFKESDYMIRYEKGSFQAGYCILEERKIVIINRYFTLESRINSLIDLLPKVEILKENLSNKSLSLFVKLSVQNETN